jgi:hypothetical protein
MTFTMFIVLHVFGLESYAFSDTREEKELEIFEFLHLLGIDFLGMFYFYGSQERGAEMECTKETQSGVRNIKSMFRCSMGMNDAISYKNFLGRLAMAGSQFTQTNF